MAAPDLAVPVSAPTFLPQLDLNRKPVSGVFSPTEFLHGTFKGEPAITIPRAIEESLAARFDKTLIGKFSQGNPGLDAVRKFLAIQNFKGTILVGLLDKKHTLIRFDLPEDYIRLFSKSIWNVNGKPMRILKWTSEFCIDREPSIVPIWLTLPMLPIHLVNESFIFSLVSSFGKPLRIDTATENLKRPSVARVQVEIDLLNLLPPRVWVQSEIGHGFWQAIELEEALPSYCRFCWHIGHQEHFCTVKYPELHHNYTHKHRPFTHPEYRPKEQQLRGDNLETAIHMTDQCVAVQESDLGHLDNEQVASDRRKMQVQLEDDAPFQMQEAEYNTTMVATDFVDTQLTTKQHEVCLAGNINDFNAADVSIKQAVVLEEVSRADKTAVKTHTLQQDVVLAAGISLEAEASIEYAVNAPMNVARKGMEHAHEVKGSQKLDVAARAEDAEGKPENVNASNVANVPRADKAVVTLTQIGSTLCDENELGKLDSLGKLGNKQLDTRHSASDKEGLFLAAPISSVNQVIEYSEGFPTSNPFEILSMPSTEKALKSSGIHSQASIQAELRFMSLEPKVCRGCISDEVFEEKFTPAKKITRTRKKKQIFDL